MDEVEDGVEASILEVSESSDGEVEELLCFYSRIDLLIPVNQEQTCLGSVLYFLKCGSGSIHN